MMKVAVVEYMYLPQTHVQDNSVTLTVSTIKEVVLRARFMISGVEYMHRYLNMKFFCF